MEAKDLLADLEKDPLLREKMIEALKYVLRTVELFPSFADLAGDLTSDSLAKTLARLFSAQEDIGTGISLMKLTLLIEKNERKEAGIRGLASGIKTGGAA